MELVARLAVLLASALAAGALYAVLALPAGGRPTAAPIGRAQGPRAEPRPIPAVLPLSLGGFVVLAAGTVLTGAATIAPDEPVGAVIRAVGVGLLAVAGLLSARRVAHRAAAPDSESGTAVAATTIATVAWAGAALATLSWLLAIGALVVALVGGLRVQRAE